MPSARDAVSRRERVQFEQQLAQEQRDREDHEQYAKYAKQSRELGGEPLNFEEWRTYLPAEEQDATLRGTIASSKANWNRLVKTTADMVATQALPDETLLELGFNPKDRVRHAALELNESALRATYEQFLAAEPEFDLKLHNDKLTDFLDRNRLFPTLAHMRRAFELLMNLCILTPKPEPQPEKRVNLAVEPDPQIQRQNRLRDYEEKPVVHYQGRDYTQRELDAMDSETYAKVMRIARFSGILAPARAH